LPINWFSESNSSKKELKLISELKWHRWRRLDHFANKAYLEFNKPTYCVNFIYFLSNKITFEAPCGEQIEAIEMPEAASLWKRAKMGDMNKLMRELNRQFLYNPGTLQFGQLQTSH
jgi:hypothetical protein